MLPKKKKTNYTRFIIYFVILIIVYQCISRLYSSFTPSQPTPSPSTTKTNTQTMLQYEPNNATYFDFPWYQTAHTRPQYVPSTNLTTTHLSRKEREIYFQKAILQAKKRAQKRFPPLEYETIRGTSLSKDQTVEMRSKLECYTKGYWKRDEEAYHVKHIQDAYYNTCDAKFYKTHSPEEKREALKYSWQSDCALPKVSSKTWCRLLKGRNILLAGDLVHYQYHELLLDAFRDEPTVCFGELNCKDHTICKNKDTRLRYIRNDILSTIRKFQNREGGHPLANIIEWPFVTSNILSSYPILILSRSSVLGDDDILFTRRLIHTMRVIRETSPDTLVIYQSTLISHPFCDDATQPTDPLTDDQMKYMPYGWSETKRRNAIAKAITEASGGIYLDVASIMEMRPDGHIGGQDCSRYCMPGPLDVTTQLLYQLFLTLEQ